jgi:hypothetical protein
LAANPLGRQPCGIRASGWQVRNWRKPDQRGGRRSRRRHSFQAELRRSRSTRRTGSCCHSSCRRSAPDGDATKRDGRRQPPAARRCAGGETTCGIFIHLGACDE